MTLSGKTPFRVPLPRAEARPVILASYEHVPERARGSRSLSGIPTAEDTHHGLESQWKGAARTYPLAPRGSGTVPVSHRKVIPSSGPLRRSTVGATPEPQVRCVDAQDERPLCRSSSHPASAPAPPGDGAQVVETQAEQKGRTDVTCYRMFTAEGSFICVEDKESGKRWRFDQKSIDFELACEADALQEWLQSIQTRQLPGLLMLLAGDVNDRANTLKELKAEQASLRQTEDYEFFGLDGECTDKQIERAYRQLSTKLHPDKGGDEESFTDMRRRYDQLKALRCDDTTGTQGSGGSIEWDPNCRSSMLHAHAELRDQLIWATKEIAVLEAKNAELRTRQRAKQEALEN